MAPYTCLACSVIFAEADIQRYHYKTDWHRYNLKRKISELPPVTEEEFQRKLDFQTKKKEEKLQDKSGFCRACNKSFSTNNAYENHIKSKKHRDLLEKYEKKKVNGDINQQENQVKEKKVKNLKPKAGYIPPVIDNIIDDNSDEWEDVSDEEVITASEDEYEEESEALPPTFCLFCPHESVRIEDNLQHMSKSHSFFIPDIDYVVELEAFLIYLGAKVGDGKVCLKCNTHSRQFRSIRACQSHMTDKGHCTLDSNNDAMLEYADFYDFSSSYPDNSDDKDIDSELSTDDNSVAVDPETLELILPSGARAGHRALKKYYSQNLTGRERENKTRAILAGVNSQYKALGYHGTTLSMIMRKNIEARKTENMKYSMTRMSLGVKSNKLQKHFRKQQMYCG